MENDLLGTRQGRCIPFGLAGPLKGQGVEQASPSTFEPIKSCCPSGLTGRTGSLFCSDSTPPWQIRVVLWDACSTTWPLKGESGMAALTVLEI